MSLPVQIGGIAWYKESEYEEIKSVMDDRHVLPATYDKWLVGANEAKKRLKKAGIVPVEAYLNPAEFVAWCKNRGLNVDAKARTQYASFVAYKSYQHGTA